MNNLLNYILQSRLFTSTRHIWNPFYWLMLFLSVGVALPTYGISLFFAYLAYVRMFQQKD